MQLDLRGLLAGAERVLPFSYALSLPADFTENAGIFLGYCRFLLTMIRRI